MILIKSDVFHADIASFQNIVHGCYDVFDRIDKPFFHTCIIWRDVAKNILGLLAYRPPTFSSTCELRYSRRPQ